MEHKKKRLLAVSAALTGVLLLAAALDVRLRTVVVTVPSAKVTKPVRLVQISDLHSCAYGQDQRTLLDAVDALRPDAVVFTGDIVDDRLSVENAYVVFAALAKQYPCYYVTGNHEYWGGAAEDICNKIQELGVTLLRGTGETRVLNGQTIQFLGIDDPESNESAAQLSAVGEQVRDDVFSVLLAHRPEEIEAYLQLPFDLILSGHAHGGQWRIPGLLNGLLAPNQGLFPDYAGGSYAFENTTLIVSRGLARESTRIPRIFNRPELVAVDILPETAE